MKIKHRILSILLVFSLLFSLPIAQITSYADTPTLGTPGDGMQDNTASGGETEYNPGNPSKGEIAQAVEAEAKWWISPFNQGLRFSIVDTSGNRVTNSVDIVRYNPFGLLDGTAPDYVLNAWNEHNSWFGNVNGANGFVGQEGLTKNKAFFFSNGIKTEEYTEATWSSPEDPQVRNAKVNGYDIETNVYEKKILKQF